MKRYIISLSVFLICGYLLLLLARPLVAVSLEKKLSAAFLDSKVSIGACGGNFVQSLSLRDIKIGDGKAVTVEVKEVLIRYTPFSLMKKTIRSVSLKDAVLCLRMPQEALLGAYGVAQSPSGGSFLVDALELSNISIDVASRDVILRGVFSAHVSPGKGLLDSLTLTCEKLEAQGAKVHNVLLKVAQEVPGMLKIDEVKYNKVTLTSLWSKPMLHRDTCVLSPFFAQALGGILEGSLSFTIAKDPQYALRVKATDANLENIIHDFDLAQKAQMTGMLNGELQCEGKGLRIGTLRGAFAMPQPGGTLTIKDTRFLERMAQSKKQSLEILVESFKDYHYNIGDVRLGMQGEDIAFSIGLDGPQGKRAISIVVHDLIKGRNAL